MGGDQTFVRVGRRHPDVEHRHVRPMKADRRHRFGPVAGLGDDLASDLTKDGDDPGASEEGVIGDDYAHGRTNSSPWRGSHARAAGCAKTVEDVLRDVLGAVHEHAHVSPSRPIGDTTLPELPDDTGHDGVDGRLRVLREPTAKVEGQRRGRRDGRRVADQGFLKTGASQDAGMDPVGQDAQFVEGPARGVARRRRRAPSISASPAPAPPVRRAAARTRARAGAVARRRGDPARGCVAPPRRLRRFVGATHAARPPGAEAATEGSRSGSRAALAARSARRGGRTATNGCRGSGWRRDDRD